MKSSEIKFCLCRKLHGISQSRRKMKISFSFYVHTDMKKLISSAAALLFSTCISCGSGNSTAGTDPMIYTFDVRNFSPSVFHETETVWKLISEDLNFSLPETPFQKVLDIQQKDKKTVTVCCGEFSSAESPGPECLEDAALLRINSDQVRKAASDIPDTGDPVSAVESFVYNYITNKINGIPMIHAQGVLNGRSGDCTEHTVLTVALLRAKKIPARAAAGILLIPSEGGRSGIFGFHMWAEAWYSGKWRIADATRPGQVFPDRYVAFAYHDMNSMMPKNYFTAMGAVQNLKAEYSGGR